MRSSSTPRTIWTLSLILAILIAPLFATPAFSAAADYQGLYSGTYTGDDTGVWIMSIDGSGTVDLLLWSTAMKVMDGSDQLTVTDAGAVNGVTLGYGSTIAVSIDDQGAVTGTASWTGDGGPESATVSGNKTSGTIDYSGTYSGSFTGDVTGTITFAVNTDGSISGTITPDASFGYDPGNFSGYADPNGLVLLVLPDGDLGIKMNESDGSMSGDWLAPGETEAENARGTLTATKDADNGGGSAGDYQGLYSGSFSGDDTGVWIMSIDASGTVDLLLWSTIVKVMDGSDQLTVTDAGAINGVTLGFDSTIAVSIDDQGAVTGTASWTGDGGPESATVSGNKTSGTIDYSGNYSGSFTGDVTGAITFAVNTDGSISGTITPDASFGYEPGNFSGYADPNGLVLIVMPEGDLGIKMNESDGSMSGDWFAPGETENDNARGTLTATKTTGGGSGSDGGSSSSSSCFITTVLE